MKTIALFNQFLDRIFSFIPGMYFGIFSCVSGLGGDIIAMIYNSKYNLNLMISTLGTGPGGFFFNFGTIISGFLAGLLFIYLIRALSKEDLNRNILKGALISALVSCGFFILIGIFPSLESNIIFFYAHGISAFFCFLTGAIYILLFSYLIIKSSIFPNIFAYIGFLQISIIIVFLFTWIPLTEWLMTIGIIVWILSVSLYMIYKKL
jgi:hypothetical protein